MTALKLPENLSRLDELSQNLWWSWNPEARELFRYLDYQLWNSTHHNPTQILKLISTDRLSWAANDPKFLELYNFVFENYDRLIKGSSSWFIDDLEEPFSNPVAYFSMEFGLHQSIPIYSGGLGVLAGDINKEASDLGIPFVGVGFMYHQGYFTQTIPMDGWQQAKFKKVDFSMASLFPVLQEDGKRLMVTVNLEEEPLYFQAWYIKVGRNKLYLIDTDIKENKPWYRGLSSRLYGGDHEMRLNQEIVLGFGGAKLLENLQIKPSVFHLNEGHCSFVSLRRIQQFVKSGMNFEEALAKVRKTTVFTTHTPVPAGHDRFNLDQIVDKFDGLWDEFGISKAAFLQLGIHSDNESNRYNMTVLGFKTAHLVNGVSKLHTEVTREMWKSLLQNGETETELIGVTNGVHLLTWISGPMRRLLAEYVDSDWIVNVANPDIWNKVQNIPNDKFWSAKNEAKKRLFSFIRENARTHLVQAKKSSEQLLASGILMNPDTLTIGFARRFATYKRANLIFRELETLQDIINDPKKPVQIIFAGKAHPADERGKYLLQQVYEQAVEYTNGGRVAFIENYDMHIARFLVQGVDLWLNNPIRPYEASGTSGIKASINGAPHFSVLDGWWEESYDTTNGWIIGGTETIENEQKRDEIDSKSLYDTLMNEIVPAYYNRDKDGIPNEWIKVCKEAIRTVAPNFSSSRMVQDYTRLMYTK